MENQSAIVIALYEEEKTRLEDLIDECMNEIEGPTYLLASYHQNALAHVNRTLQILNNLEDNLYDQKSFILDTIARLRKDIECAQQVSNITK